MFRRIKVVVEEGKFGTTVDFRRKELFKKEVSLGSVGPLKNYDPVGVMFLDLIRKNRGSWSCELRRK